MRKIAIVFLFTNHFCFSQSPGGVNTGLALWLKSDSLTSVAGNISTWYDLSGNNIHGTAYNSPQLIVSQENYNNGIFFNGSGNSNTLTTGASYFRLNNGFTNFNGITSFVSAQSLSTPYFGRFYDLGNGQNNNNLIFGRQNTTTSLYGETYNGVTGAQLPAPAGTMVNGVSDLFYLKQNSGSNLMELATRNGHWNVGTAQSIQNVNRTANFIGLSNWAVDGGFHGYMNEVIIYNRTLSLLETQKIYSYLGIKYGKTISNSILGNQYINTSGLTIFSDPGLYFNHVIGIGRDDSELLYQKQSKTEDDSLKLFLSTLAPTNGLNSGSFSNDQSYIVIGANTGKLNATNASMVELPSSCSCYSRIEREWKLFNSSCVENYSIRVKLNNNAVLSSINVSDLRLLVDDDGDFSNGGTSCYFNGDGSGINFSYLNPELTISGMSPTIIPVNSHRFITIASVDVGTPLPIYITSFYGLTIDEREILLQWSFGNTNDAAFYNLEKLNSTDFSVSEILNSSSLDGSNTYSFIDNSPQTGLNYYRLKLFDLSSNLLDEETIVIDYSEGFNIVLNNTLDKLIVSSDEKFNQIELFDSFGKLNYNIQLTNDQENFEIDVYNFSAGIYYLNVHFVNGKSKTVKFLKQ